MSSLSAYRIDNQSVNEEHRHATPDDDAQLQRSFAERLKEKMKIKVLER